MQLLIVENFGGDPSSMLFHDRALVCTGLLVTLCAPLAVVLS